MAAIPPDVITQADVEAWYLSAIELKKVKAREILLRQRLARHFFPTHTEGTNTAILPDGYQLKGVFPVTRDVEIAAFTVLKDKFIEAKINVDALIVWKPSLAVAPYRELTAEQNKLFDQCLIVKDGTPALEIVPPAKPRGKAGAKAP